MDENKNDGNRLADDELNQNLQKNSAEALPNTKNLNEVSKTVLHGNKNYSETNLVENTCNENEESDCEMSDNGGKVDSILSVNSTKGSDSEGFLTESDEEEDTNSHFIVQQALLNDIEDTEDNADVPGDFNHEYLYNMYRLIRLRRRKKNPELPGTVTKLETREGATVYVVGTAHFSLESQADVSKTIQQVLPDVVVLELCKSRMSILTHDEESILNEAANLNFEKMKDSVTQNGFLQGLMYILLLSMSAKITKSLGMAPGGEFRRANAEATKNCGCIVQLGDRPIHITIQRALAALTWWQTLSLGWQLLFQDENITAEDVEKCKNSDLLEKMISDMTGQYPELTKVFVEERDKFLAYQLQLAARSITYEDQAESEQNPTVVVGVVGIGHVQGIVSNWETVRRDDIIPLMIVPEKSTISRCLRLSIRISLFSMAVWGLYKITPSSVKELVPSIPSIKSIMSKVL